MIYDYLSKELDENVANIPHSALEGSVMDELIRVATSELVHKKHDLIKKTVYEYFQEHGIIVSEESIHRHNISIIEGASLISGPETELVINKLVVLQIYGPEINDAHDSKVLQFHYRKDVINGIRWAEF